MRLNIFGHIEGKLYNIILFIIFFCVRPPPELLPVMGPLERCVTPTLDAALLCSSSAGSDLVVCRT